MGAAWFAEGATFIWLGFMLKTWKMRVFGLAVLVVASLYTVLYSIQLDTGYLWGHFDSYDQNKKAIGLNEFYKRLKSKTLKSKKIYEK